MAAQIVWPVRIALVGCGGISREHAKGILAHLDKIRCVALCDLSENRLKERSEQLGGITAQFSDWKAMLSDIGGQLDAVLICVPNHLHAQAVLDVAAAHKHILSEKPLCITLEEADRIAEAVRRGGITYMAGHNQLFMPAVREARRLLEAGEIGAVRWIRSVGLLPGGARGDFFKGTWRADLRRQGGGELIDGGFHPTYRLLYLANAPVVGVRASFSRFRHSLQGEDTACVQVRFGNGVLGEVFTSWAMPQPYGSYQIHVMGERGQLFGQRDELYLFRQGET